MPQTLNELAAAMANYEKLVSEVPIFEKKFPPIDDKMVTLGKTMFYEINVEYNLFPCDSSMSRCKIDYSVK